MIALLTALIVWSQPVQVASHINSPCTHFAYLLWRCGGGEQRLEIERAIRPGRSDPPDPPDKPDPPSRPDPPGKPDKPGKDNPGKGHGKEGKGRGRR